MYLTFKTINRLQGDVLSWVKGRVVPSKTNRVTSGLLALMPLVPTIAKAVLNQT